MWVNVNSTALRCVCPVCVEATRCILLLLFLYVMKLRAFILQSTQFHYVLKEWKQAFKIFKVKTMQVGLVKKYWNKRTNIWHPKIQHSALLQPYLTSSKYCNTLTVNARGHFTCKLWHSVGPCRSSRWSRIVEVHCVVCSKNLWSCKEQAGQLG